VAQGCWPVLKEVFSGDILLCQIFPLLLQIEIDDVITINPELAEELPTAEVKENFPLQENVTTQVSALVSPVAAAHLKPGLGVNNSQSYKLETSDSVFCLTDFNQKSLLHWCCSVVLPYVLTAYSGY